MKNKPKTGFFSLTSCEGCQFVILDLGKKLFDFFKKAELVDFSLIEEKPFPKPRSRTSSLRGKGKIDIAFIEGVPITKADVELLTKVRKQSKILVALGNCAALGGIPEMKNYQGKEKTIRFIYKKLKGGGIANPEIKEIDNFVKVNFVIPGCPISGEEFLKFANELIKGKIPKISEFPICSECPLRGTPKCFLARKKICLGLITLAGCQAICPKNEIPCLGCRGLLKKDNIKNFFKILESFSSREEVEESLEIFGIKDDVDEVLK